MIEEKFWASVRLCLVLSLAAYAWILKQENKAYVKTYSSIDNGFLEFMSKPVRGKKLHDFVDEDSVGVFSAEGKSFACAQLIRPIPPRAR